MLFNDYPPTLTPKEFCFGALGAIAALWFGVKYGGVLFWTVTLYTGTGFLALRIRGSANLFLGTLWGAYLAGFLVMVRL